jgi:hypothetical protein
VRDLASQLAWWTGALDFMVLQQGRASERGISFALIRREEALVELIERSDAAAPGETGDRSYVRGIFKAGFFVSDLEAAVAPARAHGAAFSQEITQPAGNPFRTFAPARSG